MVIFPGSWTQTLNCLPLLLDDGNRPVMYSAQWGYNPAPVRRPAKYPSPLRDASSLLPSEMMSAISPSCWTKTNGYTRNDLVFHAKNSLLLIHQPIFLSLNSRHPQKKKKPSDTFHRIFPTTDSSSQIRPNFSDTIVVLVGTALSVTARKTTR